MINNMNELIYEREMWNEMYIYEFIIKRQNIVYNI